MTGHETASVRILMVGLDTADKTTLLYKLELVEVVTTIPTIGINDETRSWSCDSMNHNDVWIPLSDLELGGTTTHRLRSTAHDICCKYTRIDTVSGYSHQKDDDKAIRG